VSKRRRRRSACADPRSGGKGEIENRLFVAGNRPRGDLHISAGKKPEVKPKVAIPTKPKVFNLQNAIQLTHYPYDTTAPQIDQRTSAFGI
jgi:hypothetical protein